MREKRRAIDWVEKCILTVLCDCRLSKRSLGSEDFAECRTSNVPMAEGFLPA